MVDLLVNKKTGDNVHGLSDIFCYLAEKEVNRDSLKWTIGQFDNQIEEHIILLKQNYIPESDNLLSLLAYRYLVLANAVDSHPSFDAIFNNNQQEYDKIIKQTELTVPKTTINKKELATKKETKGEQNKKTGSTKKVKEVISPEYLNKVASLKLTRATKGEEIPVNPKGQNVLITSALPYVNNEPHLGNLIGAVLSADVYSRFCRIMGRNSIYICGTDEYGTATETKALLEGKTPKEICDYYNKIHQKIYDHFDIDFDYFGRTSNPEHTKVTQEIFKQCYNNNYLICKKTEQLYCNNCKRFIADRFVIGTCPTKDCGYEKASGDQCDSCGLTFEAIELLSPKCLVCSNFVESKPSEHLFIDLEKIDSQLKKFAEDSRGSRGGVWTSNSVSITNGWFKTGLKARCITRDLKWGVPVPLSGFEDKCFYVWFDAPIGYISITAGYSEKYWKDWWQPKAGSDVRLVQFMGKDNVPFHTILFPSSLIAANSGWNLLHSISTTEYLNYEDAKFSKRHGTGVFGSDVAQTGIPVECWRYYLISIRPESSDTQFQWSDFAAKVNTDLLSNFGNLVNRVLKFVFSKLGATIPLINKNLLTPTDNKFLEQVWCIVGNYVSLFDAFKIRDALKSAMEISSLTNKYVQDSKIWESNENEESRNCRIAVVLNIIRFVGLLFDN